MPDFNLQKKAKDYVKNHKYYNDLDGFEKSLLYQAYLVGAQDLSELLIDAGFMDEYKEENE